MGQQPGKAAESKKFEISEIQIHSKTSKNPRKFNLRSTRSLGYGMAVISWLVLLSDVRYIGV